VHLPSVKVLKKRNSHNAIEMAIDAGRDCFLFPFAGASQEDSRGDDYRTSHLEVKWANNLFLMKNSLGELRMSFRVLRI
jgi:hypothetical protein